MCALPVTSEKRSEFEWKLGASFPKRGNPSYVVVTLGALIMEVGCCGGAGGGCSSARPGHTRPWRGQPALTGHAAPRSPKHTFPAAFHGQNWHLLGIIRCQLRRDLSGPSHLGKSTVVEVLKGRQWTDLCCGCSHTHFWYRSPHSPS